MKLVTWQMTYGYSKMPNFRPIPADILPSKTAVPNFIGEANDEPAPDTQDWLEPGQGLVARETRGSHRANRAL